MCKDNPVFYKSKSYLIFLYKYWRLQKPSPCSMARYSLAVGTSSTYRWVSFCSIDYRLVSEVSGLCLSVFVTSDRRMLWFTSICFA